MSGAAAWCTGWRLFRGPRGDVARAHHCARRASARLLELLLGGLVSSWRLLCLEP